MTTKNPTCSKCGDTGSIDTGNNDLPCDCPAGETAKFNQAGVRGPVTGREVKQHFLNDSPKPILLGREGMEATALPGRKLLTEG